ncbi:MAG: DNA repair protein RecO, partial [Ignavibacteriales bacterium]
MEWEDEAFVLSARAFGETGAIVELLTAERGKFAAHVAGGASRKMKPFLQPGAKVIARYRSRVSEQLGSASLEPIGEGPASLFDDPLALAGLASAASIVAALPEREPHPGAFHALEALIAALANPDIWP